jgi:hypothetical protein
MMILKVLLVSLLVQAYTEGLTKKIEAMKSSEDRETRDRVINLDEAELMEVYQYASETWHILLINSTDQYYSLETTFWATAASKIFSANNSFLIGKANIDKSPISQSLIKKTTHSQIITLCNGYVYVYTGKILIANILDLIENRSYTNLPYQAIQNWRGEPLLIRIFKRTFFSLSGLIFLLLILYLFILKLKKKVKTI